MQTPNIPIMLADAHPCSRIGLYQVLMDAGFEILGEVESAEALGQQLHKHTPPFLLLLACNLLPEDPLPFVTHLRRQHPQTQIVLYLANCDGLSLRQLAGAGVQGMALKKELAQVLVQVMQSVAAGNTLFSPLVQARLLALPDTLAQATPWPSLTEREGQMIRLLAQGLDNRQMATELGLAHQTVRNYLTRLYRKIDVHCRMTAVQWARQHGLLDESWP